MRKVLLITILVLGALTAQAQVWMTDVCDTVGHHPPQFGLCKSHGPFQIYTGGNRWFTFCHSMGMGAGICIDENLPGTFRLGKKYSKLTFWLGSGCYRNRMGASVLQIKCDGQLVYDEPVFSYAPPQFVTIDVKDVEIIKFTVVHPDIYISMTLMQLWQDDEKIVEPHLPITPPEPGKKVRIPNDIHPYYIAGAIDMIGPAVKIEEGELGKYTCDDHVDSFNICRHEYYSGMKFHLHELLMDDPNYYSYFWVKKQYEKMSFIVGPNNNKSSNSSAWLVVYGDKHKILHESIVRQTDLPRQVVVDISGQDMIAFGIELRSCDLLGQINFAAVDINLHPKGDTSVPKEGIVNPNKETISALPSPCSLMKNIKPYSVRGKGDADATQFTGVSKHITFSMGGVKFTEGFIMTTGSTFLGDPIDSYYAFDLAEEYDYISFWTGMLTKRRSLQDDRLLVYADDSLVLDTMVRCVWPNQYFEVPIHKCRTLKFAKPGHGTNKDCYLCVADIALYRGKPVKNNLFVHDQPECPKEADLIDLCGSPYFHYVGRYLSSLTNFDFNDCFISGGSLRNYFQMKDGSKIYKGIMLEANVPLGIEDISFQDAFLMFFVGAGSAISSTDFSAYTGTSAGGGLAGQIGILHLMNNQNGGQAAVASFNTYGEYESLTFSVANKSEYWDDVDMVFNLGERIDHHYRLNVFADQRLVKTIEVYNTMEPQTITVPLYKCQSLTFWLEPGITRSGQFILYDMKVSKKTYVPQRECWYVQYVQDGTQFTIYGYLTEEELMANLMEMENDSTVSNIVYGPAPAKNKSECEKLYDGQE